MDLKKTSFNILILVLLAFNTAYSNSLMNNTDNSVKLDITPSLFLKPYYNYGIYKESLAVRHSTWFIFIEPVVTNSEVGKQILGTDFNRFGLNGRIVNAFIKYNFEKI